MKQQIFTTSIVFLLGLFVGLYIATRTEMKRDIQVSQPGSRQQLRQPAKARPAYNEFSMEPIKDWK